MNYLAELRAFYDRLELNPLPSPAIALWHALMSIANKTGWQQEFTVAVSVLVLKSGLNAQAIKRARNRLEQDGFLTWKSRGGNQSAVYHLNSLVVQNEVKNVPQCVPQSEPQSDPQTVPQSEPQNVPIIKHKQKLNKNTNIDTPISPTERFEEFWAAYPKKGNRFLVEQEYCTAIMSGVSETDLVKAAGNYAEHCKDQRTKSQFIKNPENFIKDNTFINFVNWKRKQEVTAKSSNNKFNNFNQREYDYDVLEKQLLGKK